MTDPFAVYRRERVLGASQPELVLMLFNEARRSLRAAAAALREGRLGDARPALDRAGDIVASLHAALDPQRGGELSRRLAALYEYVATELLAAERLRDADRLTVPLQVLDGLAEAWAAAMAQVGAPAAGGEAR